MEKGGHQTGSQTRKSLLAIIIPAHHALCRIPPGTLMSDRSVLPYRLFTSRRWDRPDPGPALSSTSRQPWEDRLEIPFWNL